MHDVHVPHVLHSNVDNECGSSDQVQEVSEVLHIHCVLDTTVVASECQFRNVFCYENNF